MYGIEVVAVPNTRATFAKATLMMAGSIVSASAAARVDRRIGQELPAKVVAPLGVEASLQALEELSANDTAQRAALSRQLEQLVYEARKAFEQYDAQLMLAIGLVAGELERRWNEKLEEIEAVTQRLSSLDAQRYSLSTEEETTIRSMGNRFAEVWQNNHCPPTLKKMIFRTAIEEIVVRNDQDKKSLELLIQWKGGAHTQLAMERPRSARETATPTEALEIIRCMAVRHGDDQIASPLLNRRGYSTGKGKRWRSDPCGDSQAQPFHCRSTASLT